jgi:hypothetical protein
MDDRRQQQPNPRICIPQEDSYPCAISHDYRRFYLDCPGWGWCVVCERCGTVVKTDPEEN